MTKKRPLKKIIERVHCNGCHQATRHLVVGQRTQDGFDPFEDDPSIGVSWSHRYTLLECQGCEAVVLRRIIWFSEWDEAQETFFPPRISRIMPLWKDRLDKAQQSLLQEIYAALHADSPTLATMGARALVDMVMNDEVGDIGGFAAKMKEMKTSGVISQRNADTLEAALDAGHAAAHRGHRPHLDQVEQVMDIVENLLHTTILKNAASILKASTPKRAPKKKAETHPNAP